MRFVVVDASVAVKWYVHEQGRQEALALLENEEILFIAPDIFLPEVVGALLRQHRERKLARALLNRALSNLELTRPQLIGSTQLMSKAVEIALLLRHPVQDCLYLSLAERWNTTLVTADLVFATRCREKLPETMSKRLQILGEQP